MVVQPDQISGCGWKARPDAMQPNRIKHFSE
jgi:hypothetical protein